MSIVRDFPGGRPTNEHFWQRWSYDYLQELEQRQRGQRTFPNLQLGDVVLLRDDKRLLSTGQWLSSTTSTQDQMASFEWPPLGPPREPSDVLLQKSVHYLLLLVTYNLICLEVAVCSGVGQILCNIFCCSQIAELLIRKMCVPESLWVHWERKKSLPP